MREFNSRRTHAPNGEELSEMFIGEDGLVSIFYNDDEAEVIGGRTDVFGDAMIVKIK